MGSPENETGRHADEAEREVVLADGFWMAKYEWPRALWRGNGIVGIDRHKLHPVNMVSQSKDTRDREIRPMNAPPRSCCRRVGSLPCRVRINGSTPRAQAQRAHGHSAAI